jgi:uncharacterized protein YoxC
MNIENFFTSVSVSYALLMIAVLLLAIFMFKTGNKSDKRVSKK